MEISDFFDFGSKLVLSTVQAHPVELKDDENRGISHLKLIKGNYFGIHFPVIFMQAYGNKFTDILDTGHAGLYLISDRMKMILEENKLTGWQIFPIRFYDKKGNEISGYQGFSVIGRCGPINYEKAQIIEKRRVPTGPICKFYKGLHVGLDQWDGADFFIPDKTYGIIVSKRAANILKENKITNLRLENLVDIEMTLTAQEKSSPL